KDRATVNALGYLPDSPGGTDPIPNLSNAPLTLGGRWIDDEILLYTEAGYYWGSYEAGQFVHLRFPGDSEIYPIAQFANQLYRPDLIRAVLKGDNVADVPKIRTPPQIYLQTSPIADGKLEIMVEAKAIESLRAVKLFLDGRLLAQFELDGPVYRR